jgi:hypothetical protein
MSQAVVTRVTASERRGDLLSRYSAYCFLFDATGIPRTALNDRSHALQDAERRGLRS